MADGLTRGHVHEPQPGPGQRAPGPQRRAHRRRRAGRGPRVAGRCSSRCSPSGPPGSSCSRRRPSGGSPTAPVDVAVVEVGLGGRWDATNVVDADVAVITNVSYDHVEVLGPTLDDIATEKAGIIKPGCRVVVGETDPELLGVFTAAGRGARGGRDLGAGRGLRLRRATRWRWAAGCSTCARPAARYPEVFLSLHGAHQGDNAAVRRGRRRGLLRRARWRPRWSSTPCGSVRVPGRIEIVGRAPARRPRRGPQRGRRAGAGRALVEELAGRRRRPWPWSACSRAATRAPCSRPCARPGSRRSWPARRRRPGPCRPRRSPRRREPWACRPLAADTVAEAVDAWPAPGCRRPATLVVTGSLYVVADGPAAVLVGIDATWADPGSLSEP